MKGRKGQDLAEWALAVALISVVVMFTLLNYAPKMRGLLDYITVSLHNVQQKQ